MVHRYHGHEFGRHEKLGQDKMGRRVVYYVYVLTLAMGKKRFSLGIDYEEFCVALHGSCPVGIENTVKDDFYEESLELVQLLSYLEIKATFFISSKTAEVFPEMISVISDMGHEIGSHGHRHIPRQSMSDDEFLYDCKYSKEYLEDITHKRVKGYRSPLLSISRSGYMASLEILSRAGYRYDSSIIRSKYERLRRAGLNTMEQHVSVVPLTDIALMGMHLNIAGGSIWRLLPARVVGMILESRLTSNNTSLYVHPYEFARKVRMERIIGCVDEPRVEDYLKLAKWNLNNRNTASVIKRLNKRAHIDQCSLFA